jgi:hypothetical protein
MLLPQANPGQKSNNNDSSNNNNNNDGNTTTTNNNNNQALKEKNTIQIKNGQTHFDQKK